MARSCNSIQFNRLPRSRDRLHDAKVSGRLKLMKTHHIRDDRILDSGVVYEDLCGKLQKINRSGRFLIHHATNNRMLTL